MNNIMWKCPECNQIFEKSLNACPNCGCPASECKQIFPVTTNTDEVKGGTTDTGYKQENVIKKYADLIFIFSIVIAIIYFVVTFGALASNKYINAGLAFLGLFASAIVALLIVAWGFITKAILYIYASISINVHEINMKIK